MGKEYIVQGALCLCKYGATPGLLKVTDNSAVYMNGKLVATNMTFGNAFQPPGFGVCRISPMSPKPCTPAVVKWSDPYKGVSINGASYPIIDTSKGTCASGTPDCIMIQKSGQIPIPGLPQVEKTAFQHQLDMDPAGHPNGLKY